MRGGNKRDWYSIKKTESEKTEKKQGVLSKGDRSRGKGTGSLSQAVVPTARKKKGSDFFLKKVKPWRKRIRLQQKTPGVRGGHCETTTQT